MLICSGLALPGLVPAVCFTPTSPVYARVSLTCRRDATPSVSVLIPARNEEAGIGAAVSAALDSQDVEFEVVVLDDHSDDATAEIVVGWPRRDARVRLARGPELPDGLVR